jgi:hypothetical protein
VAFKTTTMKTNTFIPRHEIDAQEIWDMYSGLFIFKSRRKKKCLLPIETILENLRKLEMLNLGSAGGGIIHQEIYHWTLVKQNIQKR